MQMEVRLAGGKGIAAYFPVRLLAGDLGPF